jgi:hypothetical protein
VTIKYRTQDGQADYEFSFERQRSGEWRAYIVSQPSYGVRSTDSHSTHRLTDRRDGRRYVCLTRPPQSRGDLEKVVAAWCDRTQDYIKHGTAIDRQR